VGNDLSIQYCLFGFKLNQRDNIVQKQRYNWLNRVGGYRDISRNQAAKPVDLVDPGAIGMERVDFVLLMDKSWFTLSRGWTWISPMERIFSSSVQFEVRRSIH